MSRLSDPRNVVDEFKGVAQTKIIDELDKNGILLEIAFENTLRDFNMGSIVRTANAFGVRRVHIVGRRSWNKRGAMATDGYLHTEYHESIEQFESALASRSYELVAIENNKPSKSLSEHKFLPKTCLIFGQEGPGLSDNFLALVNETLRIDQYGSTRSINVGHAAAIAMYEWTCQQV